MNWLVAGCRLQVVEARAAVRERLRGAGVDVKLGMVSRMTFIADAGGIHEN